MTPQRRLLILGAVVLAAALAWLARGRGTSPRGAAGANPGGREGERGARGPPHQPRPPPPRAPRPARARPRRGGPPSRRGGGGGGGPPPQPRHDRGSLPQEPGAAPGA